MTLRALVCTAALIVMLPALATARAIFNPKDWPEGKRGPGARSWIAVAGGVSYPLPALTYSADGCGSFGVALRVQGLRKPVECRRESRREE